MHRIVRSVFLFLFLAIPVYAIYHSYPFHVHALYQYATGRSVPCSLVDSWRAAGDSIRQYAGGGNLQSKITLLETDPNDRSRLLRTPVGDWWVPPGSINAVVYDLSEQERDIYRAVANIRHGDTVIDAGANVGVFAKKALAAGAARVISIEPAPENLACLRKNLAAEAAAGKVIIYPKGVWDKDDILEMHIYPDNSAANSFVHNPASNHRIKLPLTTMDQIVAELKLDRVDFIKMDIEGAERQAIAGARQTIQRFRPRMALCLYHMPDDTKAIPSAVAAIDPGYRMECGCLLGGGLVSAQVGHFRRK